MNRTARGFTLVEVAVVVAIIAVVAALAFSSVSPMRSRAKLQGSSAELSALLHNARQSALATGRHTVVMFFPDQANSEGGVGRVVVYEDAASNFFAAASNPNFEGWDATKLPGGASSLAGHLDLPVGVRFSLAGLTAPTFPAPFAAVTAAACGFCGTGGDHRGAIRFDSLGRAAFFDGNGAPIDLPGASVGLSGASIAGVQFLIVSPATGAVKAHNHG